MDPVCPDLLSLVYFLMTSQDCLLPREMGLRGWAERERERERVRETERERVRERERQNSRPTVAV